MYNPCAKDNPDGFQWPVKQLQFCRSSSGVFSQGMSTFRKGHIDRKAFMVMSCSFQQHSDRRPLSDFVGIEHVFDWPVCSPEPFLLENVCNIIEK